MLKTIIYFARTLLSLDFHVAGASYIMLSAILYCFSQHDEYFWPPFPYSYQHLAKALIFLVFDQCCEATAAALRRCHVRTKTSTGMIQASVSHLVSY